MGVAPCAEPQGEALYAIAVLRCCGATREAVAELACKLGPETAADAHVSAVPRPAERDIQIQVGPKAAGVVLTVRVCLLHQSGSLRPRSLLVCCTKTPVPLVLTATQHAAGANLCLCLAS